MKPISEMQHFPTGEKLVQVLIDQTQQTEPLFFRLMVTYHLSLVAGAMRTLIRMPEGNRVPANMYCLNLAPSNFGKSRTERFLTNQVLNQFIPRFLEETFPLLADKNISALALKRAARHCNDPDDELEKVTKEFENTGPMLFTFDSGSAPAAKQLRHKLLMAQAGSMNFTIDEIGLHFNKNAELLELFMELYDGETKTKLIKHSKDSPRVSEIKGITPANLMMFGTANRILDGGKNEEELFSFMDSGYGRRCFYGFVRVNSANKLTGKEALKMAKAAASNPIVDELSDQFGRLSDAINANKILKIPDETAELMYDYRHDCEIRADQFKSHEELMRIELASRYAKAIRVAGTYAFIDQSPEILPAHLEAAIRLAEDSGEAFKKIQTRDRPHVKLAKFIAELNQEVTHADLIEELSFYPKAQNARHELLTLATAWGYKNNVIIKKSFTDGIEFLRGESLEETDLDKIRVGYSTDIVTGYINDFAPFDKLHLLTQADGMHWINHHVKDGYRDDDKALPGFNIVVVDVDGGVALSTAKMLLKDYKALYYTTKRHTESENRFRIILPINYTLKLDSKDFKEFMKNIFEWLPFESDDQTGQRSRKWLSHQEQYYYTEGQLLDVLPFIPKTSKNEERKNRINDQQSLDNLERWVVNNTGDGNRNNMLLKYALILVDSGFDFDDIRNRVLSLNDKLPDKLDESEILSTVLVTTSRALSKR